MSESGINWDEINYKGNRLECGMCLHYPNRRKHDLNKYVSCKMIYHDKFRLYPKLFGGYEDSIRFNHICKYYEPAKWNISSQKTWLGYEEYLNFLDNGFYFTPEHFECNKIRDTIKVTICIGGYDEYGEIHYGVSLYDWFTGEWFKNNKLKYLKKREVVRTAKTKKPKETKLLNCNGIDDMSEFLETGNCEYLLKGGK